MALSRFFTTTITVSTPSSASVDAEGVPTTTMATATVQGAVQPYSAATGEQVLGAEEADRARRVWLPSGTDVTSRSTLTIDEVVFQVQGDPKPWTFGRNLDHIAVLATRVDR